MVKMNKKTQLLLLTFCATAVLLLGLFLFLKSPLFRVSLIQKEIHLEAGTTAETNPHVYLDGADWCVALSHVDTSSVKHTKVGRYPIYIYHGLQKFTTYVNIIDTTPPVVSSSVKNKTIVPGETISVKTLGLNIKDSSEIQSILFTKISSTHFYTGLPEEETTGIREAYRNGISMEAEEFQFAYGGIYTLTISVTDAFYNSSEVELTLTVEDAPVIEVTKDFYIAGETQIDFSDYIKVWDFISGEMDVKDVSIDTSKLNYSSAGTYPITFSATDDYGLARTTTANVHVTSQNALQELINTHAVDIGTCTIIGAKNPYDSGYYTSKDTTFIQNAMAPTIVSIQNDVKNTTGDGFILEISDEFVTIATSEQNIQNDLIVDVTFFDGVSCSGAIVGASPERNIAFLRIPIEDIENNSSSALCKTYIKKLRTVHVNKGDWEKHHNTSPSFSTLNPRSGAPLFDAQGKLFGMHVNNAKKIKLIDLLNYFEIIFKYKIHYQ